MAEERLLIRIHGDAGEAKRELKETTRAVQATGKAAEQAGRKTKQGADQATAALRRQVAQAKQLRTSGKSYREIGQQMGVSARQARQLAKESDRATAASRRQDAATKRQARSAGMASRATGHLRGRLSGAAKAAAAGAAAYVSISAAKNAITTTTDLAKATVMLHKGFGLSVKSASEWASVAKSRGVETKALGMAFNSLSKNVEAAKGGSERQVVAFRRLGISMHELRTLHPDDLIMRVADGMDNLEAGTKRADITSKLFGRGWATLGPLLRSGSKELQDQLDLAEKYGATFSGKSVNSVMDLVQAERELKLAQQGLQVQFTQNLQPALTAAMKEMGKLAQAARKGRLDEALTDLFNRAVPKISEAAGHAGAAAAKGLFSGFMNADVFGRAALGAFLLSRLGGLRALWTRAGRTGGQTMMGGWADGLSGGVGRSSGRLRGIGARIGRVALGGGLLIGVEEALFTSGGLVDTIGGHGNQMGKQLEESAAKGAGMWQQRIANLTKRRDVSGLREIETRLRGIADAQRGGANAKTIRQIEGLGRSARQSAMHLEAMKRRLVSGFTYLKSGTGASLRDINRQVQVNMHSIAATTQRGSAQSRAAMAQNFRLAAGNIRQAMRRGDIDVRTGLARMRTLMQNARLVEGRDPLGLGRGFARSFASGRKSLNDILAEMRKMPRKARREAAQAMIAYANELNSKGKLSDRAMRRLVSRMEQQLGSLVPTARKKTSGLAGVVARNFGFMGSAASTALQILVDNVNSALVKFGANKIEVAIKKVTAGIGRGKQRGGMLTGKGRQDSIPIMAAPGEAILNRHQQRPVEQALQQTYGMGLTDLFARERRPHAAPPSKRKRFARGGAVGPLQDIAQRSYDKAGRAAKRYVEDKEPAEKAGGEAGGVPHGKAKGNLAEAIRYGKSKFGLTVTSFLRPGDTDSLHSVGRAVDQAGGPIGSKTGPMAKYFKWALGHFNYIEELFYDPLGAIDKNTRIPSIGDHSDHVHTAFLRGGFVPAAQEGWLSPALAAYAQGGTAKKGGGGRLNKKQIMEAAKAGGFGNKSLNIAASVALAESGGQVRNTTGDRGNSWGLWQINKPAHPGIEKKYDLLTAVGNAKAAHQILMSEGWNAWTVYREGDYKKYMDDPPTDPSKITGGDPGKGTDPGKKKKGGKKKLTPAQEKRKKRRDKKIARIKGRGLMPTIQAAIANMLSQIEIKEGAIDRLEQINALTEEDLPAEIASEITAHEGLLGMLLAVRNNMVTIIERAAEQIAERAKEIGKLEELQADVKRISKKKKKTKADKKKVARWHEEGWKLPALKANVQALTELSSSTRESLVDIHGMGVPMERMYVAPALGVLGGKIFDTQLSLAELGQRQAGAGTSAGDDSGLADLLREQLEDALKRASLAEAQTPVFRQFFSEMRDMPYVGAFAAGGPVTETGMALVHKGEYVVPSDATATPVSVGSPHVTLVLRDKAGQLVELVDARIDSRAPGAVDSASGRRARQIRVAPGR